MGGCKKVALGCGIVMLILFIVIGLGAWWIYANIRSLGADFATTLLKNSMKELKLPADQEERIFKRLDQVSQKFKDQEITLEQVAHIVEVIGESPLIPAGSALVVDRAYLDKSGFDDVEKEEARLAIRRFVRGTIDNSIPEERSNAVLDTISSTDPDTEEREFHETLTDEQLRIFITEARKAADEAEIPGDIPEINFADEFDKAIDKALADLQKDS